MKPVSARTQSMLRDAMGRLVAGRPRVTDGRLTVANLAREAGVGRSTANRATDVLDEFHASAARVPPRRTPETDTAASRSRDAAEIADLKATVNQLAQQVQRLALQSEEQRRVIVNETGMFEIPAGGRRYRALELLVKQKRLAKTALIPCVIRESGIAEEDSLAENVQRAPLHPLEQFRAFLALREKGRSEEEIAAAFFVAVSVVKQRLRLASVSPRLLEVYADDSMTLDQLMAFTVNDNRERQEQVFERISQSYAREPHVIRRMLTEGAVRAADKRAQFVGLDAYVDAGGVVMRDLFQGDDGGWLQDTILLDRLVAEKLAAAGDAIRAEGWKWIEVAPDFAYGHTYGLRQIRGEQMPLTDNEQAARDALQAEMDGLEEAHASADELPEEIDRRLAEIEAELAAMDERPTRFDAEDMARAGAFVSIDGSGSLRVERGYVRPEDEAPVEPESELEADQDNNQRTVAAHVDTDDDTVTAEPDTAAEPEEDEGLKPLPDRLLTELTAHRTLALRYALGEHPDIAFTAALHALCLKVFYRYGQDTCLELDLKSASFGAQAPGLADTPLATSFDARHQAWIESLPKEPTELWDVLAAFDIYRQRALFAHCVSLSVNAVYESYNRKPRAMAHADRLALRVDLDMVAAGWKPTVENFLGRVTKSRILGAVREARGNQAAQLIDHLKKGEMAAKAEELLAGSGWLPEPLRTPGRALPKPVEVAAIATSDSPTTLAGEETAANGGETAMAEDGEPAEDDPVAVEAHPIAAE